MTIDGNPLRRLQQLGRHRNVARTVLAAAPLRDGERQSLDHRHVAGMGRRDEAAIMVRFEKIVCIAVADIEAAQEDREPALDLGIEVCAHGVRPERNRRRRPDDVELVGRQTPVRQQGKRPAG